MQRPAPAGVRYARAAAWIVALSVLLNVPGMILFFRTPKPELPSQHLTAASNFVDQAEVNGRTANYTAAHYATIGPKLRVVDTALDTYRQTSAVKLLRQRIDRVMTNLSSTAEQNTIAEYRRINPAATEEAVSQYVNGMQMAGSMSAMSTLRDYRPPFLPNGREHEWSWIAFGQRYLLAWASSLPLALVGVILLFRRRYRDLVAELALAPWRPVLAVICWWWGLNSYRGSDAVERELEKRARAFARQHGRRPDQAERAALYQQVREPVLGFEAALAKVQAAPELISATPRRFALSTALCAALSVPVQLAAQLSTAFCQTVRAGRDTAAVDTTRRRTDRLTVDGIVQATVNGDGTKPSLGIVRLKHDDGRVGLATELDLLGGTVTEATVTVRPSADVTVQAGQLWPPTTYDFPLPEKSSLLRSAAGPLIPSALERGVMSTVTRGPVTLQAAGINGEGTGPNDDHRLELDVRAAVKRGPISLSLAGREGRKPFRLANASLKQGFLTLRAAWAARLDQARSKWNADLVLQPANTSIGIRVMGDGFVQAAVDRSVGSLRINPVVGFGRRSGPVWALRVQHSFTSTVP